MKPKLIVFSLLLLILSLCCSMIGPRLDFHDDYQRDIFINLRLSRVLLAFASGAILSLSGLCFQTLFNNPLASPYTLGVASGASLGAALMIKLGLNFSLFGVSAVFLGAFLGALISIFFIYGLSLLKRSDRMYVLLLSGIAFNFFAGSMLMFLQYLGDLSQAYQILRWTMGSLDSVDFSPILRLLPWFLLIIFLIFYYYRELDILLFGEEMALSKGVEVKKIQLQFFFLTSVSVGAVVAVCGPIGFVGLMVPHMVRRMTGSAHLTLAFVTIFFGGFFLTFCDTLGRTMMTNNEIPVGIITALLGGPFFLYLLFSGREKM
ncbi:MAG: iron ABC transporter permease [Candidatus Wallbacteria bacterium]|nr:iron ABC transporter permease [Candidatus Wallbacteria bacterium]